MQLSDKAQQLISAFSVEHVKSGDIKKTAKAIKKDHALALELWSHGGFYLRMLAILIFDKTLLDQQFIEQLVADMATHEQEQPNHLSEWLLANQLMKDKKLTALIPSWQRHNSPILRRLFWYHQARLRWTGQTPPDNSADLLDTLEQDLANEDPIVQWAMNFCAGQIGVHQAQYRQRCIKLGQDTGLYQGQKVPKNCTPAYLPDFIALEVAKRS